MGPSRPKYSWQSVDGRRSPVAVSHTQPGTQAAPCAHSPRQGREAENSCLCIRRHHFPLETCSPLHSPPICVKDTISFPVTQAQSLSHFQQPLPIQSVVRSRQAHLSRGSPSLPPDASLQVGKKHKETNKHCML